MIVFRVGLLAIGLVLFLAGPVPAQEKAPRFDYLVREDMFKGFEGDMEAFDRAMALCDKRLAENPLDAEALVWHGAGLLARAGAAFQAGGRDRAVQMVMQAMAEMAKAVDLKPNDVAVLIPRATALLGAATHMTNPERRRSYAKMAVTDLEKVLALQPDYFPNQAPHPKGELLGALAEAWWLSGDADKARAYLARMVDELRDTKYATAALLRLENPAANAPITCLGCHNAQ